MIPCLLQRQGHMYQLNSRNLKTYCKYSYNLPASQPKFYPQFCVSRSSLVAVCVFLLAGMFVAVSLSAVFQTIVECFWAFVILVPSDVPSLEILAAWHCHSIIIFFPPPLIPQTLEYNWPSFLAPLRFMCSPSLAKSSTQQFGSMKVTPNVFSTQSYLLLIAVIRRRDTSLRLITPLRTILDVGNLVFQCLEDSKLLPQQNWDFWFFLSRSFLNIVR